MSESKSKKDTKKEKAVVKKETTEVKSVKKEKRETSLKFNKNTFCSALMYIPPYGLLWFFLDEERQKNELVRYHFVQGLLNTMLFTVSGLLMLVIAIGQVLGVIGYIAFVVFSIIGIINAFTAKKKELPLIGKYKNKVFLK